MLTIDLFEKERSKTKLSWLKLEKLLNNFKKKLCRIFTSSVNSTTGVVAAVGVDEAIEMGSFSIGGVDEIGVNADV